MLSKPPAMPRLPSCTHFSHAPPIRTGSPDKTLTLIVGLSLQTSQGGAAYFAGKGIKNSADKQEASVGGAIAAAHYIRAVAPLYGIPVVRA